MTDILTSEVWTEPPEARHDTSLAGVKSRGVLEAGSCGGRGGAGGMELETGISSLGSGGAGGISLSGGKSMFSGVWVKLVEVGGGAAGIAWAGGAGGGGA